MGELGVLDPQVEKKKMKLDLPELGGVVFEVLDLGGVQAEEGAHDGAEADLALGHVVWGRGGGGGGGRVGGNGVEGGCGAQEQEGWNFLFFHVSDVFYITNSSKKT